MDSGALFAAARSYSALADRADALRFELAGDAEEVRAARFEWKGPASYAFADLVGSLAQNMQQASDVFRQVGGQLNQVAQKVQEAEDAKRKADIAAKVGVVVTVLAIAQLGLDPVNDGAAAGVDGGAAAAEATAAAAETAAEAEAASAFAALADMALAAVRGLGAFLAPHVGAAAFAGGQAIFVDLLATGKIDWSDVRNQVAIAGLIGVSTGAGSLAITNLTRDGETLMTDELGQQFVQQNTQLERDLMNPGHEWNYTTLSGGPLSDYSLKQAAANGISEQEALRGSAANTFASGKYDAYKGQLLLFKAGDKENQGSFFTLRPPASEAQARIESAIKDQWVPPDGQVPAGLPVQRSDLTHGYVYVLENPDQPVYVGPTSSQGGPYLGGEIQAFVPNAFAADAPRLRLIATYDLDNPPPWVLQMREMTAP